MKILGKSNEFINRKSKRKIINDTNAADEYFTDLSVRFMAIILDEGNDLQYEFAFRKCDKMWKDYADRTNNIRNQRRYPIDRNLFRIVFMPIEKPSHRKSIITYLRPLFVIPYVESQSNSNRIID